ncbi:CMP-N-acetylneuraminate-poly-alpha-2,8-sialyltransferase-like [Diadema antillarum]|uniref:CMP-N-acetylneuraminate-poly-alpha-2, 8-sialyltransferase-like n=1 Tax=Diadema antillarum TaxID=105358 RepID=UPI003A8AA5B9
MINEVVLDFESTYRTRTPYPTATGGCGEQNDCKTHNHKIRRKRDNSPIGDKVWNSLSYFSLPMCSSSTKMRRRLHSRRTVVMLAGTCILTIFCYHFVLSALGNIRRSSRSVKLSPSARYLTEAMHGGVNESTNFTHNMWMFKNSDAERLYLYTKLLEEHVWTPNEENMNSFRYELNTESNVTTDHHLIITQDNVKLGEEIPCYVVAKSFWQLKAFTVEEEFLATLPKASPLAGRKYKKCAVVGNSGSLNNTGCGQEIDNFDFVFRCNAAPVENYRNDAGSKTDFITFNPSILYKHFGGLSNDSSVESYVQFMQQYNSVVWYPCFGSRKLVDPCRQAISYQTRISSQLVIGHPRHYTSMWAFWKRRGLRKRPSTGLYLVGVAATMCEEIHLYGFWPFPVEMRGDAFTEVPYHYFDKVPFTNHHNADTEFRIILQMHMHGVVNLHTGVCKPGH